MASFQLSRDGFVGIKDPERAHIVIPPVGPPKVLSKSTSSIVSATAALPERRASSSSGSTLLPSISGVAVNGKLREDQTSGMTLAQRNSLLRKSQRDVYRTQDEEVCCSAQLALCLGDGCCSMRSSEHGSIRHAWSGQTSIRTTKPWCMETQRHASHTSMLISLLSDAVVRSQRLAYRAQMRAVLLRQTEERSSRKKMEKEASFEQVGISRGHVP